MQGDRTLLAAQLAAPTTLADLIAAGELTCSAAQVAQFLHLSKPTVIAAARRGELPGRRVGKQWRFSCRDRPARSLEHRMTIRALRCTALRIRLLAGDAALLRGELDRLVAAVAPWLLELSGVGRSAPPRCW